MFFYFSFAEYKSENGKTTIDRIFYLQNDPEMFKTNDFRDRNIISKCIDNRKNSVDKFTVNFWGYENITAKKFDCVTFHGTMSGLKKNLEPKLYK